MYNELDSGKGRWWNSLKINRKVTLKVTVLLIVLALALGCLSGYYVGYKRGYKAAVLVFKSEFDNFKKKIGMINKIFSEIFEETFTESNKVYSDKVNPNIRESE